MSKAIYTGVGGIARKVPKLYVGVGGVARKVKKGYVGVGGVARLFYSSASARPPRLPSGYTELDYIYTNSSTTYINTGVKPEYDTTVIIDAQIVPGEHSGYTWYGYIVSSGYTYTASGTTDMARFDTRFDKDTNNIYCKIGYVTDTSRKTLKETQIASNLTSRFQITMNTDGTCSINGIDYPRTTGNASLDEHHGGWYDNTRMSTIELARGSLIKLYSCQIYSGGTMLRELVPCKNAAGIVGMYDLVGNKLYQSENSSYPFLAGPAI